MKSSSSEARVFQKVERGFEDLEKQEMHNKRRKHNRDNAKQLLEDDNSIYELRV